MTKPPAQWDSEEDKYRVPDGSSHREMELAATIEGSVDYWENQCNLRLACDIERGGGLSASSESQVVVATQRAFESQSHRTQPVHFTSSVTHCARSVN